MAASLACPGAAEQTLLRAEATARSASSGEEDDDDLLNAAVAAAEVQHKRERKGFGLLKGRPRRGGDPGGEAPVALPSPRPAAVRSFHPSQLTLNLHTCPFTVKALAGLQNLTRAHGERQAVLTRWARRGSELQPRGQPSSPAAHADGAQAHLHSHLLHAPPS